jgi:hypothetical protein
MASDGKKPDDPAKRRPAQVVAQPVRQVVPRAVGDLPAGYPAFLEDLKTRIRTAQVRAALAVNRELIHLYWSIGRDIVAKQQADGWGTKVIDCLAVDLQHAFPGLEGFSRANVYRMRAFFLAYPAPIVAQPVGQLGWSRPRKTPACGRRSSVRGLQGQERRAGGRRRADQ